MILIQKSTKIISIFILAASLLGCGDDDAKLPEVVAGFTSTVDNKTGTVTFANESENANSYLWGFGNNDSSIEENPVKTFASGTYTVSLTASNTAGDLDTFSADITVEELGIATNGGFETGDDTGWMLFQNGGSATLDNTTNNGGTWSGKLATNGASNPAFKQERIAEDTVQAEDIVQITFDHTGTVVNSGGVFNVLLFGESAAGASFTHVFNPAPTLSDSWSTFTGTFTIPSGTDVSEGISFLIETVCGGDAGCSVSANIDNVSVILNP